VNYSYNNNMLAYKAPVCQKTSQCVADTAFGIVGLRLWTKLPPDCSVIFQPIEAVAEKTDFTWTATVSPSSVRAERPTIERFA